MSTCYQAHRDFRSDLEKEIGPDYVAYGDLLYAPNSTAPSIWAQNTWFDAEIVEIDSISHGAKILKERGRNWVFYPDQFYRRCELIKEKLPYLASKPYTFPVPFAKSCLGTFTLIEKNKMLLSANCTSPFANGFPNFLEDKVNPPSRAYLKLYEALTLFGELPKPGEKCLEIGAAPGGWTYVLANLGAEVIACDRAPLAANVQSRNNVKYIDGNAFLQTPEKVGPVDWIFSDIICYPDKLYDWILNWIGSEKSFKNAILTIKLQGPNDYDSIQKFLSIKNSSVRHLFNNKHELTWFYKS